LSNVLLEMRGITKRFPGVIALNKVDLRISRGEVLAVVGENGAGKSTLIKILSGAYQQDEGTILFGGSDVGKLTPRQALDIGIATIYQELTYVPGMSIAENIYLGVQPQKRGFIDYKKLYSDSMEIHKQVGLEYLSPVTKMINLSVAERQLVEIGRAYSKKLNIIIMDEPTSALNQEETEKLFSLIRKMKSEGKGIIYITHKLDEVFEIADRVQVLRNGESVFESRIMDTNKEQLINNMCGRELKEMYPVSKRELGGVIFEVKNLSDGFLKNISLNVRRNEIVGLYGLMGAGCSRVVECAFGARKYISGEFFVGKKKVVIKNPRDARAAGLAYVPDERKTEGLMITHSVRNNITIVTLANYVRGLFLNLKAEREGAQQWVDKFRIKVTSIETPVLSLSGGNQQKIVLAKWLAANPKVFLLNDPTRGIDVGAKVEIYKEIESLCKSGCGVLYVASELPELIGIADRIYVMHEGVITGEYEGDEITQKNIVKSAIGE
jgi:ribose transport system ATP-binding protein